ncbi:MAG TPA: hypothetical protein VL633_02195 [Bacteroidota bacterium]|nr:hypothetical protein [Bacteroidota bacterium]
MNRDMKNGEMNDRDTFNRGMKGQRGMNNNQEMSGSLQSATCDICGFMVRSHNEKEIASIMKTHQKKYHHKTVSDKDVKDMIRNDQSHSENDIKQQ